MRAKRVGPVLITTLPRGMPAKHEAQVGDKISPGRGQVARTPQLESGVESGTSGTAASSVSMALAEGSEGGIPVGSLSETRPRGGSKSVRYVIFLVQCIAFLLFTIIFCVESDVVWNPTLSS